MKDTSKTAIIDDVIMNDGKENMCLGNDLTPSLQYYKQKKKIKGEDFECQECGLQALGREFDVFGVFDGHGGPDAAQLASQKFCFTLVDILQRTAQAEADAEDGTGWEQRVLPNALVKTFESLNSMCNKEFETSGTTATIMVVTRIPRIKSDGWALVTVANVGDSHAYAEVSNSVVRLSADHRLDNNAEECERVTQAGGEVARCSGRDDSKADDPLRLWPGGLMMSRTIGDPDAKHSLAIPEISNMLVRMLEPDEETSTPIRIIIASDGLWDAVTPKQTFSIVRRRIPQAASQTLIQAAVRNAGKDRDDITVILVDIASDDAHFIHPQDKSLNNQSNHTNGSPAVAFSNSIQHYYTWNPFSEESARADISAAEAKLFEERQAFEAEKNAAIEERERLQAALQASMEDEEAMAARRAAEEAAEAAALAEEEEWEPVVRNSRRKDSRSSSIAEEATMQSEQPSEEADTNSETHVDGQENSAGNEQGRPSSKNQKSTKKPSRKVCFTFKESGSCSRGDRCKFLHSSPGEDVESTTPNGDGLVIDGSAADGGLRQQATNQQKVCFTFQRSGSCSRGDRCKFLHAAAGSEPTMTTSIAGGAGTQTSKSTKTCHSFERSGSCSRGDRCKFMHVAGANNETESSDEPSEEEQKEGGVPSYASAAATVPVVSGESVPEEESVGDENIALDALNMVSALAASEANNNVDSKPSNNERQRDPTKTRSSKTCFTFERDGTCRFGDKCKYTHGSPAGGPGADVGALKVEDKKPRRNANNPNKLKRQPPSKAVEAKDAQEVEPKQFDGPKKCFAFQRKGSCKFGETCKFSHATA